MGIVVKALHAALEGHRVVADSPFDNYWMETLAAAAGIGFPGSIEHISVIFDELKATAEEIALGQIAVGPAKANKHRARHDALWLRALIREVTKASSHRMSAQNLIATQKDRSASYNGEFP